MNGNLEAYLAVLSILLRAQRSGDSRTQAHAIHALDSLWNELSELEEKQAIAIVEEVNSGQLSVDDIFRPTITVTSQVVYTTQPRGYEVKTRTPRVTRGESLSAEYGKYASAVLV